MVTFLWEVVSVLGLFASARGISCALKRGGSEGITSTHKTGRGGAGEQAAGRGGRLSLPRATLEEQVAQGTCWTPERPLGRALRSGLCRVLLFLGEGCPGSWLASLELPGLPGLTAKQRFLALGAAWLWDGGPPR